MKTVIDYICDNYNIFITLLALILLIWGTFNDIRFKCLSLASQKVAEAEGHSELTGSQKFSLCLLWINEELPTIFNNLLVTTIIKKMINLAYNTSFDYMNKYIKRKTGIDASELIEKIKNDENANQ